MATEVRNDVRTQQSGNASVLADMMMDRFFQHLRFTQGKAWERAQPYDFFVSLALAVRDQLTERMMATKSAENSQNPKFVYYLSMEYLLGRLLRNNLVCLGVFDEIRKRFNQIDLDLDLICELNSDAGLGNGGLGRLAACYLDSATTLGVPFYGYGIRYEYGIFEQEIVDGWQVEQPDFWLRFGSPWELIRPELSCPVRFYGRVENRADSRGNLRPTWVDYQIVTGVPHDVPIIGFGRNNVNVLRLWAAHAADQFDLSAFNSGGFVEAVRQQAQSETISRVLYPSDETPAGRELRLMQQYFFVACTLSDIIRRYETNNRDLALLADKAVIQLNDTHPTLAVVELMRILIDERGLDWDQAWETTQATFAYTNHTLLPEALEMWPVELIGKLLPRHLQLIFEINQRFLDGPVRRNFPNDGARRERLSLIAEAGSQHVRMAHLAIVGSHKVNGVAALHTDLLKSRVVPDFAALWPEKFVNVTNGVTPRRWLLSCNPALAEAITARIGSDWITNLDELRKLEPFADDPDSLAELRSIKDANKHHLMTHVQRRMGLHLPIDAIYDVQIKRLHEYKRQLMNILYVVMRYHQILDQPGIELPTRVVLFGAKAAPAYHRAKLIIKLINDVARTVNRDPRTDGRLKVAFLPNYNVSLAEKMIPASDLSEQISTAGKEASGTGNMKFAMNGALTIGTLDGANIEIRDAVGEDNFFLFGLTADEVAQRRPVHNPWETYNRNTQVRRALDAIAGGEFNRAEPDLFKPVFHWLMHEGDPYMLLADIESYAEAQARVDALWRQPDAWARAALLNIARMGFFSSDRSIRDYCERVWNVRPMPVELVGDICHFPRVS